MNWLERARREIEGTSPSTTANSAERSPTAVMAVRIALSAARSAASNGSNGSAPTGQLHDAKACEERASIMEFDGGLSRDYAERVAVRHWRWLVALPEGPALDVAWGSRITRGEVLEQYPEATGAEPIPDAPRTPARGRSISEVVRGIVAASGLSCDVEGVIAEIEAWPPDDHAEMLADAALAEAAVRSVAERHDSIAPR